MGVTPTVDNEAWDQHYKIREVEVEFDDSYTNGGETVSPSDINLSSIQAIAGEGIVTSNGHIVRTTIDSNGDINLQVFDLADGAEVADTAADVDTETATFRVWGS